MGIATRIRLKRPIRIPPIRREVREVGPIVEDRDVRRKVPRLEREVRERGF